jgi:hypothetical protein
MYVYIHINDKWDRHICVYMNMLYYAYIYIKSVDANMFIGEH